MRGCGEDIGKLVGMEGVHRFRHLVFDVCPTLRLDFDTREQRLRDQRNGDSNAVTGQLGGVVQGETGLAEEFQAELHRRSAVGGEQHSWNDDGRCSGMCAQGAHEVLEHGAQLLPPRRRGIDGDVEILADAVAHGVD
ncbi:hypothetical protein CH278_21170 [Rhodococcus sp. 05-2254-5]|nr:hypothetical protein CH278_21170 [Rhodococcus sp. 05-2254-5]